MSTPRRKSNHVVQHDVPPENILDLRQLRSAPQRVAPRSEVLEHFWTKRMRDRRQHAPLKFRVQRNFSGFGMRTRAVYLRYRFGAFPFIAAGMLAVFAVTLGLGRIVEIRSRIYAVAQSGYDSLRVATARAASRDLSGAANAFQDAAAQFSQAKSVFDELNPTTTSILAHLPIAGSKIRSGKHLLNAAELLSAAGAQFSDLALPLAEQGEGFHTAATFLERLQRDQQRLGDIVSGTEEAIDELQLVRSRDLPSSYRAQVEELQRALPILRQSMRAIVDGTNVLTELLGVERSSEELFVFQNANELRPTGGFLGSFALITLDQGIFRILDAPGRGSFSIDDHLPPTIAPPLPLQVITPSWSFRDANWYPDFPTSALQLSRFYQLARGFEPDGVIAVTHTFLERMLSVTGPIELPAYGITVDSGNVTAVAQQQVERGFDLRANDPKKFIVDLIPILTDRLSKLDLALYPKALAAIVESLAAGDLQLWSRNPETQSRIVSLGWSGSLPETEGDFLSVVDTNVGGGKTDGVIDETIRDEVTLNDEGTMIATVTVTRTHRGTMGDLFTGSRNRTYHRLYVPLGSKLLSAEGFSAMPSSVFQELPEGSRKDDSFAKVEGRVIVDERTGTRMNDEFGKTVFGNWTEIDPGQTETFRVSYELPFRLTDDLERYDLTIQRQAGARNRTFDFQFKTPSATKVAWASKQGMELGKNSTSFSEPLQYPENIALVLQR